MEDLVPSRLNTGRGRDLTTPLTAQPPSSRRNSNASMLGSFVPKVGRRSSLMFSSKKSGKRTGLSTAQKAPPPPPPEQQQLRVLDVRGFDVTPKALVVDEPPPPSVTQQILTLDNASVSGVSQGTEADPPAQPQAQPHATGTTTPTSQDEAGEGAAPPTAGPATEVVYEPIVAIAEDDLCEVRLTETDTMLVLSIPNRCVSNDSQDAKAIESQNQRYKELLAEKEQSEKFSETATQTLHGSQKDKGVQKSVGMTCEADTQATVWEIYDTTQREGAGAAGSDGAKGKSDASSSTALALSGPPSEDGAGGKTGLESFIRDTGSLAEALTFLDRAVMQNVYHKRLLAYRDFQLGRLPLPKSDGTGNGAALAAPDADTPTVEHLWDFTCDVTSEHNVSCMVWNKMDRDLLAVGYGAFEFSAQKPGIVAFWSLRNPQYPEHIIHCKAGVTSMDFSESNYNLLAVGMYDGTVSIFDVHSKPSKPIIESGHTSGKHSDPVWNVKWVNRGSERGENLVSISTDGRITQWSIKKGLEHIDLMKLKRIAGKKGGVGQQKNEAFISRRSSGMCFDFSKVDSSVYVAGTEEGNIHKCSCSYSEQYLESYVGHMGPVYQVTWSPFNDDIFLSASADWTMKLWDETEKSELLTFQSGTAVVNDVQWSPTNSTAFASVTKDGRIEIWDMKISTLKPVVSYSSPHTSLNCILFNGTAPIIAVGTDKGTVSVFRLFNIEDRERRKAYQAKRLKEVIHTSVVKGTKVKGFQ